MSNVTGYYVYKDTNPTPIANLPGANNTAYTATSLAASTQYQFTVTSYDSANVQSPRTSNVTVTTSTAPSSSNPYPRVGCLGISSFNIGFDNAGEYFSTAVAENLSRCQFSVIACISESAYDAHIRVNSPYLTVDDFVKDIKARAAAKGINATIVGYVNFNEVFSTSLSPSIKTVVDQNNWWLYENGVGSPAYPGIWNYQTDTATPQGSYPPIVRTTWPPHDGYLVNMSHYSPKYDDGSGFGPLYPYQYFAKWTYDVVYNNKYNNGISSPTLDGYFVDNVFFSVRTNNQNYDTTRVGAQNTLSWPDGVKTSWSLGIADFFVYGRVIGPLKIWGGNIEYPVFDNVNPYSYYKKLDHGLFEHAIGTNSCYEMYAGTADTLLKIISAQNDFYVNGAYSYALINVEGLRDDGTFDPASLYGAQSPYQGLRYSLGLTSMTDGYFNDDAIVPGTTDLGHYPGAYNGNANFGLRKWDEITGGEINQYGWLGAAVDGPQSSPSTGHSWSNGNIYARRFTNGAVFLNTRGNGIPTQTITLTNPFGDGVNYKRIKHTSATLGDATLNDGSTSAVSLQSGDAVFVVKTTTPAPAFNPSFPRIGAYWLSGTDYNTPTNTAKLAKLNVAILGFWPGWDSIPGHKSFEDTVRDIKAINPNTKVFNYINNTVIANNGAYTEVYNKIAQMHWFLYEQGTSGTAVIDPVWGAVVNNSIYGAAWIDWFSQWSVTTFAQPTPSLDGFFTDNIWWEPRNYGDWNLDGTTDSPDTAQLWQRQGFQRHFSKLKELMLGKLQLGNIADWGASYSVVTGYENMLHGGLIEHIVGQTFSPETWGGFNVMMDWYRKTMDLLLAPKLAMFHQPGDKTDFQSLRYGLAACLMDNGYFTFDAFDGTNVPWFDEYDSNLGYPVSGSQGAVQTSSWKNGIWRRDFDNGIVLVNPKGNGDKNNISLDGTFYKIQGTSGQSDLNVNNGSQVTTISLKDRDGIILKRAP